MVHSGEDGRPKTGLGVNINPKALYHELISAGIIPAEKETTIKIPTLSFTPATLKQ